LKLLPAGSGESSLHIHEATMAEAESLTTERVLLVDGENRLIAL
jgi:hypothetical protein